MLMYFSLQVRLISHNYVERIETTVSSLTGCGLFTLKRSTILAVNTFKVFNFTVALFCDIRATSIFRENLCEPKVSHTSNFRFPVDYFVTKTQFHNLRNHQ